MGKEGIVWKYVLDHYLNKENLSEDDHDTLLSPSQIKKKPPSMIMSFPRLFNYLEVMNDLMKEEDPVKVTARCKRAVGVLLGFGNAS